MAAVPGKIEVGFRQAIHQVGSYAYHFWLKAMPKNRGKSGDQYLHKKPEVYRKAVRRKIEAYHRYVQLGCIAQGLLQYLSLYYRSEVWACFRSWMRTMKIHKPPSEQVVSKAMRATFFEFLLNLPKDHEFKKNYAEHCHVSQIDDYQMVA